MEKILYEEFKKLSEKEQRSYINNSELWGYFHMFFYEKFDELFLSFTDEEKVELIKSNNFEELFGDDSLEVFTNNIELFTDEEKVEMIIQLEDSSLFEKNIDLFTDEQKRSFIKSRLVDSSFLDIHLIQSFSKNIDLFTDDEKVEIIKGFYGDSGRQLFYENIQLFKDKEKAELIKRYTTRDFDGNSIGLDVFSQNIELFTDDEKVEVLKRFWRMDGLQVFRENIELFTDKGKVELIKHYGRNGQNTLELYDKYEKIFSDEDKRKMEDIYFSLTEDVYRDIKRGQYSSEEKIQAIKSMGRLGSKFFIKNIKLFTNEEIVEFIKHYGRLIIENNISVKARDDSDVFVDKYRILNLFRKNIALFTDEEKVDFIISCGKNGLDLFSENIELFTDKQKVELIMGYGEKALYLFYDNSKLFTNEEIVMFLRNCKDMFSDGQNGVFISRYIDCFSEEEKKEMIMSYGNVWHYTIFEKNIELFTDKEKVKFIMKYGASGYNYMFNKYEDLFTSSEKVKYLINYFDDQFSDKKEIYNVLKRYGKEFEKEDINKLLMSVYPEGNALQFYNKLNYLPNEIILDKYPADQIDKFDKKIWMRLSKMDLYYETYETKSAFIEMALSLGIFEKDDKVNERIAFIEKLANFLPKEYEFTGDISELGKLQEAFRVKSQKDVRVEYKSNYDKYYENIIKLVPAFFKNYEQFNDAYNKIQEIYGDTLSEKEFQDIISANYDNENYAKAMEQLMNCIYDKKEIKEYELCFKYDFNKLNKENKAKAIRLQKELRKFYWSRERKDMMTPDKLHRIFDGMDMKYKPGFFEFFKNNLREILAESDKQQVLAKIQRNWEKIVETNLGQRITFEKCEKYFMENVYENVVTEADREIAKLSLQSGYTQEQFDIARQIYEEQRTRKKSSIPLIEEKDGKNGYRYKVLRLDDPTTIFVGELTNCCQAIDNAGESCMRHSATSENGRVLVVLDESGKVLSQSWLWRNQNILCFDNIEAVEKDKENRKVVGKEILDTVIRAAEEFLEVDKVKMEEWKKQQKELLIRKLQNKEITQEEYNSRMNRVEEQVDAQMLSKVTVGQGYTDVSLAGLERDNEDAYPIEFVSYTADSRTQFVLAGTTDCIIPKDGEFSTISLYEDGEEYKKIIEIDTSEIGDDSYEDDYQEDFEEYDEQEQNGNGFMGYDEPDYDSGEFGNDEYQSRMPENLHVIVFRDEVYRDDTEFYFDIEEKFVREDIKKKQNRFYSKSKKRNKSLSELVEEKKELDKKLEEAKELERKYARLAEARARGNRE